MAEVDAVDLALAEKLEGLAAAMRRGDVAGLYLVWVDWDEQVGILHTGNAAVEMAELSLEMSCELITVGEMN
jgi:hypothetical protein